jgi:hypothetical protein
VFPKACTVCLVLSVFQTKQCRSLFLEEVRRLDVWSNSSWSLLLAHSVLGQRKVLWWVLLCYPQLPPLFLVTPRHLEYAGSYSFSEIGKIGAHSSDNNSKTWNVGCMDELVLSLGRSWYWEFLLDHVALCWGWGKRIKARGVTPILMLVLM